MSCALLCPQFCAAHSTNSDLKAPDTPHHHTIRKLHKPALVGRPWGSLNPLSHNPWRNSELPKDSAHAMRKSLQVWSGVFLKRRNHKTSSCLKKAPFVSEQEPRGRLTAGMYLPSCSELSVWGSKYTQLPPVPPCWIQSKYWCIIMRKTMAWPGVTSQLHKALLHLSTHGSSLSQPP